MLLLSFTALASWTIEDRKRCEALDVRACDRWITGLTLETPVGYVSEDWMHASFLACQAGLPWACGIHFDDVGCAGLACTGMPDDPKAPPLGRQETRIGLPRYWVNIGGSAVSFDGGVVRAPDGAPLTPRLAILTAGFSDGALWLVLGQTSRPYAIQQVVRVDPDAVQVWDAVPPDDVKGWPTLRWGGEAPVVMGARGRAYLFRAGQFEPLAPPVAEARLHSAAGATQLWQTANRWIRVGPSGRHERPRNEGELVSVHPDGEVLLTHEGVTLWLASGEARRLAAAGEPGRAEWIGDTDAFLAVYRGLSARITREGEVTERAFNLASFGHPHPLGGVRFRTEGTFVGAVEPLPGWVPRQLKKLPSKVLGANDDGAPPLIRNHGTLGFAIDGAATFDGTSWTMYPFVDVEVRDAAGRPLRSPIFRATAVKGLRGAVWPFSHNPLPIISPEAHGAKKIKGRWVLEVPVAKASVPAPVQGEVTGRYFAKLEPRDRESPYQVVNDDLTLLTQGRWLLLRRAVGREGVRLAYRLGDGKLWVYDAWDQTARIMERVERP